MNPKYHLSPNDFEELHQLGHFQPNLLENGNFNGGMTKMPLCERVKTLFCFYRTELSVSFPSLSFCDQLNLRLNRFLERESPLAKSDT